MTRNKRIEWDQTSGSARTNGFAVASLVLGIVWVLGIGSLLAVGFGHVARRQISDANHAAGREVQRGAGIAMAGLLLGWIGLALLILLFIVTDGEGLYGDGYWMSD